MKSIEIFSDDKVGITIFMTSDTVFFWCARVAKPGQRRWIQGPFSKGFVSSNLTPRISIHIISSFQPFFQSLENFKK